MWLAVGVCHKSTRRVAQCLAPKERTCNLGVIVTTGDLITPASHLYDEFSLHFLLPAFLPTGIIILELLVLYTNTIRDADPEMTCVLTDHRVF